VHASLQDLGEPFDGIRERRWVERGDIYGLGFHDPAGERECSARGAPHIGENNLGDESVNVATDERAPELRVTRFSCTVEPHISALTPGAGRTTVPQGAAPLVIFAAFKLVSAVP
jgi:hypothetical protein